MVTRASTAGHRALLIKANGPNFSRGAELKIFHERGSSEAKAILERYFTIARALEALPIPVIAGVQGLCQASGQALIGATTFLGGAQRLARRCGDARALEIVYTADIYSAATFERWNIVNRIIADEILHREALALAKRLVAGPTRAHGMTKHLVRTFNAGGLPAADAAVLSEAVALWDTADMQSAVARLLNVDRAEARAGGSGFSGR